jgi:hypothetical protein
MTRRNRRQRVDAPQGDDGARERRSIRRAQADAPDEDSRRSRTDDGSEIVVQAAHGRGPREMLDRDEPRLTRRTAPAPGAYADHDRRLRATTATVEVPGRARWPRTHHRKRNAHRAQKKESSAIDRVGDPSTQDRERHERDELGHGDESDRERRSGEVVHLHRNRDEEHAPPDVGDRLPRPEPPDAGDTWSGVTSRATRRTARRTATLKSEPLVCEWWRARQRIRGFSHCLQEAGASRAADERRSGANPDVQRGHLRGRSVEAREVRDDG